MHTFVTPNANDLLHSQSEPEPVKVLLVDDKEDHYIMTRRLFSGMKRGLYSLDWLPTYDKGLQAIQHGGHDAYLIDHHLANKSGMDLIRAARLMGCRAPMILFTSGDDPNA